MKSSKFSSKLKELNADEIVTSKDLKDFLGSGGFGGVRRCRHKEFGIVAAKCSVTDRDKAIESLKREANSLVRINHQNIVKIFGFTQWNEDTFAIILEYCEGGSLDDLITSDKEISCQQKLQICNQINAGLAYLHHYKHNEVICHGDLKPANILLDRKFNVKLCDFGAVNFIFGSITSVSTSINLPQTHQHTPCYTSPERLVPKDFSAAEPKPSMDMYSFAIIVYELLTQIPPYDEMKGAHGHVLTYQICYLDRRPDLKEVDKVKDQLTNQQDLAIFNKFVEVMIKCWDKIPEKRLTSKEVADQLPRLEVGASEFDESEPIEVVESTDEASLVPLSSFSFPFKTASTSHLSLSKASNDPVSAPSISVSATSIFEQPTPNDDPITEDLGKKSTLLVNEWIGLIKEERFDEADQTVQALLKLFSDGYDYSAGAFLQLGKNLQEEKKHLESILFLQISSFFAANESDCNEVVKGLRNCAEELQLTSEEMVESDVTMKRIVRGYVIPLMYNIRNKIKNNKDANDKERAYNLTWCLYSIEYTNHVICDEESCEQDLREAITLMEEKFQQDALKYGIYATCLHNLGTFYKDASRFDEGKKYFWQAMEAHKKAENVSEVERNTKIEDSKAQFKICKDKLAAQELSKWVP